MDTLILLTTLLVGMTYGVYGGSTGCQRVVCYYTNWAQYRPGAYKFYPENIDPKMCTHIMYAFAKMTNYEVTPFEWNDETEPWRKGMYERTLKHVKGVNPDAKILLSIGGWNMGSTPFTAMVHTDEHREHFATTSIEFLREHGFDGLDIDWEYPANRGSPPEDRDNYISLLKELRRVVDAEAEDTGSEKLLITAAVSAGKSTIDTAYDVPSVAAYLDFITLMSYDLHGSWESFTGHNSPLYSRLGEAGEQAQLNVDYAATYWVNRGMPKGKLVIGLSSYGRSFTLKTTADTAMGAPTVGPGKAGKYTRSAGFLAYYEICELIHREGTKVVRESEQRVPYLVHGDQWVGYDDKTSLMEKVRYMKDGGYGGVMVWALDLDDFTGELCEDKYPLMNAIVNECYKTAGSSVNDNKTTVLGSRPPGLSVNDTKDRVSGIRTLGLFVNENKDTASEIRTTGSSVNENNKDTASESRTPVETGTPMSAPRIDVNTMNTINSLYDISGLQYLDTDDDKDDDDSFVVTGNHINTAGFDDEFCEEKMDGLYADLSDCGYFYTCAHHMTSHMACPAGLAFNDYLNVCDWPNQVPRCSSSTLAL